MKLNGGWRPGNSDNASSIDLMSCWTGTANNAPESARGWAALQGTLIGSSRSGDRKDTKAFLEDKLGADDSALAILVTDADWEAAQAVAPFGGEELMVELTPDAAEQIAELSEQEQVAADVAAEVEIEEEA